MHRLLACLLPWLIVVNVAWAQSAASVTVKHEGAVLALAWSSDGKRLASASDDGIMRVTEIPSGKELVKMNAGATVSGIVFSPDGKLLGVKSGFPDGPLSVWDLTTQKRSKQLEFKGYSCHDLAFTPDGNTLVASGPGEHMVWNHTKGGGYGSKGAKIAAGSSSAVSPDGAIVAWCDPQGSVTLFYPDQRKTQRMRIGPAHAFTFSPDANFLAASHDDKTIHLWAVLGTQVRTFEGLRAPAKLLHFSANGKVLAAASPDDPVVRLWDADSARLRRRLSPASGAARALALAPDGRTVAVGAGNIVTVWNVATRDLGELGKPKALTEPEIKTAWDDLAGVDPARAEAAFRALAQAQHHAVDFLNGQVRAIAVPTVDWKRVEVLLAELDQPVFQVRQHASQELIKLGEIIKPAVEKYLASKPSLEGQRRASKLLDRMPALERTADRVRCLEAIEILEILHTPQSRDVLKELAKDALIVQIRQAAREALDRLKRHEG